MWESTKIAGKNCNILKSGNGGRVFLWPFYPHTGEERVHLEAALQKAVPDGDYLIAAWQVEDWNRDLSPWQAPAAMGEEQFAGYGPALLRWLTKEFLPEWKAQNQNAQGYYTVGYSLAGLFALWSLYETECFNGAVCCSGSLWLDGWDRFAAGHGIQSTADIYLSLGGREEKSANPMLALVGSRTREQEALLKKDPNVRRCTLEWNPGGHFADSAARLAKGIRWICELGRQDAACGNTDATPPSCHLGKNTGAAKF